MAGRRRTDVVQDQPDTDTDKYPSLTKVLSAIREHVGDTDTPIERFELTALASGEATYRITPARAEESEGGYFSQETLS